MTRTVAVVLCIVLTAFLTGCRTSPIRDVTDAPVTTGSGRTPTLDEVGNAIVRAGISKGWQMRRVSAGRIEATLVIRSHTAVVEIPYDTHRYDIRYKSSTNLKYDAQKGTIHSNYLGWIQNLDNAIEAELGSL